jgi:hypothetical protein
MASAVFAEILEALQFSKGTSPKAEAVQSGSQVYNVTL